MLNLTTNGRGGTFDDFGYGTEDNEEVGLDIEIAG